MHHITPPVLRSIDGVFVLELGEDYSHLHEPFLDQLSLLRSLADSAEPAQLVLDMTNVKIIGTAVIGLFLTCSKRLAARGGSFALANVNAFCRTAFSLARLDSFLPVHDSTTQAVHDLASAADQAPA